MKGQVDQVLGTKTDPAHFRSLVSELIDAGALHPHVLNEVRDATPAQNEAAVVNTNRAGGDEPAGKWHLVSVKDKAKLASVLDEITSGKRPLRTEEEHVEAAKQKKVQGAADSKKRAAEFAQQVADARAKEK